MLKGAKRRAANHPGDLPWRVMFAGLGGLYYPGHRMEAHGRQRTRKVYRIVVRAEIGERFAAAFEGMDVRVAGGRTIITGEVLDQSHLHGILDRIHALGLELVSLEPASEEPRGGVVLQTGQPANRARGV